MQVNLETKENQFFAYSQENKTNIVFGMFSGKKEIGKKCNLQEGWNNIVIVLTKEAVKGYVEGNECISEGTNTGLDKSNANIFLGGYYNKRNQFEGKIDELLIYKKGLSGKEVKSLYVKQKVWSFF